MSSQTLKSTNSCNLEQLTETLLPDIADAVRWAWVRYQRSFCLPDLDDLSQEIFLLLIEDDYGRLRSFKRQSSLELLRCLESTA